MLLKEAAKKIFRGYRYSSETYIQYLRKIGVSVGNDVIIYVPSKTLIDEIYPWMITIGDHVKISEGTKILTHDYSWSVLKSAPDRDWSGRILGAAGRVTIGNDVFIGMDCIICRGVTIQDHVIIGAGSVVTKDCERNSVYAGVPAKRIMSLDEYYAKREALQLKEAKELAIGYQERFGTLPPREVFHEFFMLFEPIDNIQPGSVFDVKMSQMCNYEQSRQYLREHPPRFQSFEEFLNYCFE